MIKASNFCIDSICYSAWALHHSIWLCKFKHFKNKGSTCIFICANSLLAAMIQILRHENIPSATKKPHMRLHWYSDNARTRLTILTDWCGKKTNKKQLLFQLYFQFNTNIFPKCIFFSVYLIIIHSLHFDSPVPDKTLSQQINGV